jgi:CheY-like chemotaxis protein
MDQGVIAKIFEPFFTTKEKGNGSGLGLSMVYNIINQHNGFIDIKSEPGKGSEFSLILPLLENAESIDKTRIDEKIIKGEGLILVVDDEDIMRQMASEILTLAGYSVLIAHNGSEGVKIFRKRHNEIKAVLLDMIMPKKSGKESYIEMKEIDNNVKVILTSGFRKDESVEDVMNLGVKKYIQKPYNVEKLTQIIYDTITEG